MTPSKNLKIIAILAMGYLSYFSYQHNEVWMVASGMFALLAILLIQGE